MAARTNKRSAPVEQVEAPTTEQVVEQVAAPAPKVDHSAAFADALYNYLADGSGPDLQAAYRAIPAPARGAAQAHAFKANLADMSADQMGSVLDLLNNLPAAPSTRVARPAPTTEQADMIGRLALARYRESLPAEDYLSAAWEHVEATYGDMIDRAVKRIGAALTDVPTGTKVQNSTTMEHLIEADLVKVGAKVTGPNGAEAIVGADGSLSTKEADGLSLSAAAKLWTGHPVNGWDFWSIEGAKLAAIRASI